MNKDSLFATIKSMGEFASKDLGQNFLIDDSICENIVSTLDINSGDKILEVGAGYGSLSYFLSINDADVTLDDVDDRAISFLSEMFKYSKNVKVLKKSALNIKGSEYNKVIGNLPYYITNSLLEHLLCRLENVEKYVFMIQKEVFVRVNAKPNSDNYGPLAVIFSTFGSVKKEFIVHRDAFVPQPHVDSLVFSLVAKNNYSSKFKNEYLQFLKKIFLHRRKTILKNLSLAINNGEKAVEFLNQNNIPLTCRPEQISHEQYLKLFKSIYEPLLK